MTGVYFYTVQSNSAMLYAETKNRVYSWALVRSGDVLEKIPLVNHSVVDTMPKTAKTKQLNAALAELEDMIYQLLGTPEGDPTWRSLYWDIKKRLEENSP